MSVYGVSAKGVLPKQGARFKEEVIVTTACGLGSLSEAEAYRALELLGRLAEAGLKRGQTRKGCVTNNSRDTP